AGDHPAAALERRRAAGRCPFRGWLWRGGHAHSPCSPARGSATLVRQASAARRMERLSQSRRKAMSAKMVGVTGCEPGGHATENPTLDILERLRGKNFDGIELKTVRVPVDTKGIAGLVNDTLERYRPDVWISLGLYPGSSVVAIERTAANVCDFPVADNLGN